MCGRCQVAERAAASGLLAGPRERTERGRWRPLAAGLRGRGGEVAGPETGGPRGEGSEEERVGQGGSVLGGCSGQKGFSIFKFSFLFQNQFQI